MVFDKTGSKSQWVNNGKQLFHGIIILFYIVGK